MHRRNPKAPDGAGRDPERTQHRILAAALKEFAARGFAGARVAAIARRAKANKRMLYHYFTDKKGLFRAVLRHKIGERRGLVGQQASPADVVSSLAPWFRQNCQDADWVRLLAWESLQTTNDLVLDEKERRRHSLQSIGSIRKKQAAGRLRSDVDAACLQLAKVSLAMFPMALPQVARLITGRSPRNPGFQRAYARFLETISVGFRPAQPAAN